MCKAVEEYAATKMVEGLKKGKIEGMLEGEFKGKILTVKNMLKENIPFEVALKCAELDKATYEKYSRDMQ